MHDVEQVPERWRLAIVEVVHRLVVRDYAGLAQDGFVRDATTTVDDSVGDWIEDYPATLVELPSEAWLHASCGKIKTERGAWWLVVDLWTKEEGRSDLSLEGTVRDDGTNVRVEIANVHVI